MTKFELYIGQPTQKEGDQITISLKEWDEKNALIKKLKEENALLLKQREELWKSVSELVKSVDNKDIQTLISREKKQ